MTDEFSVEFEDNAFSAEEALLHKEWRGLSAYERSVLERLLEVDFELRDQIRASVATLQVRQIDSCGCLEFRAGVEATGPAHTAAEGWGCIDPSSGRPVDIMLTVKGNQPLWLEFHRFGGSLDYRPDPVDWEVGPTQPILD